ncbi:MAG: TIGR02147 family protein [Fibrobacterales bacterium]
MVTIFDYSDYRSYLADYYAEQKESNAKFSQRYFAQKLGIKSSGFFSDVLKSRRNLSQKNIEQFTTALKLTGEAQFYFENLVHYNQAKTVEEQKKYFQNLLMCKKLSMEVLNRDQYTFYSKWHHTAIREILFYFKFKDNYRELAKSLIPAISENEAKESISLLVKLDLIALDKSGYYKQTNETISAGTKPRSVEIGNFLMETSALASQAINSMPAKMRDTSSLTISASDNGFEKIQAVLEKARKDILKIAQNDTQENRVYHMNFQCFPLTKENHQGTV